MMHSDEDLTRGDDHNASSPSKNRYKQANKIAYKETNEQNQGGGDHSEIWENSFILPQIVQYKDTPGKSASKKLSRHRSHHNRHL